MGEYLSPGVYREERPSGKSPIVGVSTTNFACVGYTPRGPVDAATLVTSPEQFFDTFGDYTKYSDLAVAVTAFFQNEGKRAYIVRVVPDDAVKASVTIPGLWEIEAISQGIWGNLVMLSITGNGNYYDEATATYSRFDVNVYEESEDGEGDYVSQEFYEALILDDVDNKDYIVSVINDQSTRVVLTDLATGGIPTELESTQVTAESVGTGTGSANSFSTTLAAPEVAVGTLSIKLSGVEAATDDGNGSLEGTGVSGTIDYETGELEVYFVTPPALAEAVTADYYQAGDASLDSDLVGGLDGDPDTIGRSQISSTALISENKGIYALNVIEEMFSLAVPDFAGDETISLDLISYAEGKKDAFAILTVPQGYSPQQALRYKRQTLGSLSTYGAIYYPWVTIADPLKDGRPRNIAPVGHAAGIYARTDTTKNVGKAPAGVNDGRLNFALGLERELTKGEMDTIYPANINPLYVSTPTGRVIWGARTLQVTGDFTQVNARRLFQFLELSIYNQTHDFVFENIGAELWSRIKLRADGFFLALFEEGYFKGNTPEEAYYIIVDETNNPPAIQNQRIVIVDYGVAVNSPAEFIIHRFTRKFD